MRGLKRGRSGSSTTPSRRERKLPGFVVACLLALAPQPLAANEDQKAHALAEQFATADREAERAEAAKKQAEADRLKAVKAAADAKRRAEDAKRETEAAQRRAEQLKADEADMLARARAEAEERRTAERRADEELQRREAERAATEAKLRAEAEAAARAKAEAENLAAAKAAADAREKDATEKAAAESQRQEAAAAAKRQEAAAAERREAAAAAERREAAAAAERAKAEAERSKAEADARKHAEMAARHAAEEASLARAKADEIRQEREKESRRLVLEEEREAEAQRLTEKIRQARAAREARREAGEEPVFASPGSATESMAVGLGAGSAARGSAPAAADDTRVTVLLVMEAGNKGIRRFNKSGDPMLCVEDVCYVGSGPNTAAKRLNRASAFGPGVALGSRAGACNNSLGCVFRDVDLRTASALIQPIDLRVIRHDRREASEARADPTCALNGGQLSCRATVATATWRAWIVPEGLAARAGGSTLQSAVAAGLRAQEAHSRRTN